MVRLPVEWGLGKMATNWKSIIYADGQKLQVRDVKRDVIIAALLTNALTILNCGQNIQFFTPTDDPFALLMPSLENYFDPAL